jgi:hypothetical protein
MTMDQIILREATEGDFARITELICATQPEPVTEADVLEWERRVLAGQVRRRMVALDEAGQAAGYSVALSSIGAYSSRSSTWPPSTKAASPGWWRRCKPPALSSDWRPSVSSNIPTGPTT